MPYKDKEKAKEYNKERMRATRSKGEVVQPDDEYFVQPKTGKKYLKKEYMLLSDGEVHKRNRELVEVADKFLLFRPKLFIEGIDSGRVNHSEK